MADAATTEKTAAAPSAAVDTKLAADAKSATDKTSEAKAEAPKAETPKAEAAKVSTPAVETPKPEATKPAATKAKAAAPKPAAKKPAAKRKAAAEPVKTTATRKTAKRVATKAAPTKPTPIKPTAARAAPIKKDTTMDTMKTTTAKAKDMIAQANDRTKTAVDKGQKMFGEMNDFSKGNIEAIVESSKIAAKGIESMGQDVAAYAKKSLEEATAAAKQMASVKSPADFMKLQSDYVRSAFDAMVAHTSKSTEAMLKLAGEVAQPISNRASLAAEKIKIAA